MIDFKKVFFTYGIDESQSNEHNTIFDMSFSIKKGECITLCGRSGSGKSTVLRLMSGLAPCFYEGKLEGDINVNGCNPSTMSAKEKVETFGVVFQDPRSQFFMDIVQDEIVFSAENIGLDSSIIKKKLTEVFQLLGIEELRLRKVDELSSGQKQKVAIASAIIFNPKVLILDEPISNLDEESIYNLISILSELKKRGTTIIISEHRIHKLIDITDKFFHISRGRLCNEWSRSDFVTLKDEEFENYGFRYPNIIYKYKKRHNNDCNKKEFEIENLSYIYKGTKNGINTVNFSVKTNGITTILGQNGSGKTTLCKVLCGLLKQDNGAIKLNEKILSIHERRSNSYFVMQDADYQLYTDSVVNELVLGRKITEELKSRAYEAIEILNLDKIKYRHPASLSGGEKQRVTIAAAYCSDADILVFDEPTSGMDGDGLLKMANWFNTLISKGKTIFIITHDSLLSEMVSDDFIYL